MPRMVPLFLLAAGCSSFGPRYPVTEKGKPFDALDATLAGSAPAAAAGVNFARLRAARSEPQNWLTYHGAYDAQRYSALDKIDAANVKRLRPAWVFQAGVVGLIAAPATYAFEATPIVVD